MSSAPENRTNLIVDFLLGRIPEEDFLRRFGSPREAMPSIALGMLRRALEEKDPEAVETGVLLMWKFGYGSAFLDVLNALALQPWHKMHEDIVFALGKLKDPSSTRILGETAVAKHSYLEHDEAFALGTKSIYALKNIGTPEAVRILGDLARNPNEALRKAALGRLKDIAKNGSTEAVRAEASAHLGP